MYSTGPAREERSGTDSGGLLHTIVSGIPSPGANQVRAVVFSLLLLISMAGAGFVPGDGGSSGVVAAQDDTDMTDGEITTQSDFQEVKYVELATSGSGFDGEQLRFLNEFGETVKTETLPDRGSAMDVAHGEGAGGQDLFAVLSGSNDGAEYNITVYNYEMQEQWSETIDGGQFDTTVGSLEHNTSDSQSYWSDRDSGLHLANDGQTVVYEDSENVAMFTEGDSPGSPTVQVKKFANTNFGFDPSIAVSDNRLVTYNNATDTIDAYAFDGSLLWSESHTSSNHEWGDDSSLVVSGVNEGETASDDVVYVAKGGYAWKHNVGGQTEPISASIVSPHPHVGYNEKLDRLVSGDDIYNASAGTEIQENLISFANHDAADGYRLGEPAQVQTGDTAFFPSYRRSGRSGGVIQQTLGAVESSTTEDRVMFVHQPRADEWLDLDAWKDTNHLPPVVLRDGEYYSYDVVTGEYAGAGGRVVDGDGAPVANATVEVWGVNYGNGLLNASYSELQNETQSYTPSIEQWQAAADLSQAEKLENRSRLLMESAQDPIPTGYLDQQNSDFDVKSTYKNADKTYPLVHRTEAWDDGSYSNVITGNFGGWELSQPVTKVKPGEEYRVSLWDPTATSEGDNLLSEDPYDSQLPGASQSGRFRVEHIGPGGDAVDSYTAGTAETHKTERVIGGELKTHETSSITFDTGVYRITAIDSGASYYVLSGTLSSIRSSFETELENKAGELEQQAEDLREDVEDVGTIGDATEDALQNSTEPPVFERQTVSTDSNGRFQVSEIPDGWTVSIQAYKGDLGVLEVSDPADVSKGDIRDAYESEEDYFGSIHMSTPRTFTPQEQSQDMEIVASEITNPRYQSMEKLLEQYEWLDDLVEGEDYAALWGLFDDPEALLEDGAVDARYDEIVVGLIQGSELEPVFVQLADDNDVENTISQDHSREVKTEQLQLALEILGSASSDTDAEGGGITVEEGDGSFDEWLPDLSWGDDTTENGTKIVDGEENIVSVTIPVGDIDAVEDVVIVVGDGGESRTLNNENITISESVVGANTAEVELEMLPGESVKEIDVVTVDDDGGVDRRSDIIKNPVFGGTIADIDSVTVNTNRPAVGEVFAWDVNGGDDYVNTTSARLITPSGGDKQLDVSQDGMTGVRLEETGVHTLQMTLESVTGDEVVETVRVEAVPESESTDMPPGLRVTSGITGEFVIASDGVDSGTLESTAGGSKMSLTAAFENGEIPDNELHIYGLESNYALQKYNIKVTDGTGASVRQDVRTVVHTADITGGHVRVGGDPIPVGESTEAGEVEVVDGGSGVTITTVAGQGSTAVDVNSDPSIIDRVLWWAETSIPNPFTIVPATFEAGSTESAVSALSAISGITRVNTSV